MQLQSALDKINELTPGQESAVLRAKLRGLLRGYAKRWANDRFNVISVEDFVQSELYNPSTKATSRTYRIGGKLDVLLEEDGRVWLMDHKTTSEDIQDPGAAYWRQLTVEGQHHHYALLQHLNGVRVDGAIWDVIKKPGISPKQVTKADTSAALASGKYFGDALSLEDAAYLREIGRETPSMYEARLANDCSEVRPEYYFQRQRIARLDQGLLEYAEELWQHSQDMLYSRRQACFPRNSGACLEYGGACAFLGICSGYDEPTSANWKTREWVHPELPRGECDGKDMLTNSRIRCFQTCRRKHYYKFELGIERAEQEDREALFFGTVMHEALAIWFDRLRGQNGTAIDEQASAVCCATGSES